MELLLYAVLLVCASVGIALDKDTLKLFNGEVSAFRQKIFSLEERVSLLENRESQYVVQKVKHEILLEVKNRLLVEKIQFDEKIKEIESALIFKQNDLSNRLEEIEKKTEREKEEMFNSLSELEKATKLSFDEVSNNLIIEKNKLLLMDNHLLMQVQQMQKKALDTFEKITNMENDVKNSYEKYEIKANMMQMQLNETVGNVQRCLASEKEIKETLKNNMTSTIEKLKIQVNEGHESRLEDFTVKIGNIETSLVTLRRECANESYVSNLFKNTTSNLELLGAIPEIQDTLTNITNEIISINSRLETVCSPPCENGGICLQNNVCNCTSVYKGHRCQDAVCSPPCENGGICLQNNVCNCTSLYKGKRCQDAVCSPPCENGGICLQNNVCNCMSFTKGHRCQDVQCGLDYDSVASNGSRSVGVRNSSALVLPWMALLRREGYGYFCEGSVIHRRFVMTSSFCIYSSIGSEYRDSLNEVTVQLGFSDLKERNRIQVYKVRAIHLHPEYKHELFGDYNIALLEVEKPIEYNLFVRPVCLPPKEIPENNPFYMLGSGIRGMTLTAYTKSYLSVDKLKKVELVLQDTCKRKIKKTRFPRNGTWFCGESTGDFSCDDIGRGNPFLQSRLTPEETPVWTQVGILSGTICSKNLFYFSHVQNLMSWVEATLKAASNA